jgi:WD40-like Beta Propeller Repeat
MALGIGPVDLAEAAPPIPVTPPGSAGRMVAPPVWNCGASCFAADSVPADSLARFGGAVGGLKPKLVYPLSGSMHPINLPDITFQWTRGAPTQQLFRIRLAGDKTYDFLAPCGKPADLPIGADECVFTMPEGNWIELAVANRGKETSVSLTALEGNNVAPADPLSIRFSPSDVAGGLYYWSTGLQGIYRLVFGQRKATEYIVPAVRDTECVGCHSVSRDGKTIAYTFGGSLGNLAVAPTDDVKTPTVKPASAGHDSSMMALSPDGSRVLVSYADDASAKPKLVLRDTKTGQLLGAVDENLLGSTKAASQPEFSPDGKEIVVSMGQNAPGGSSWSVQSGSIAVLPFNGGTFGPAEVIVPDTGDELHFYPSWSPDGKWIVFASATRTQGAVSISYNQLRARLRLVSRDGKQLVELGKATQGANHTSTMPKFAPFVQDDGNVLFITYNSKIDYGIVLKNTQLGELARPQLWLAGIDLRKISAGDPSSAPIWLPFQEVTQTNHLGYWTEIVTCKVTTACDQTQVCETDPNGQGGSGACVFVK